MRLDRVTIRNYKSIKSIELRIPQKEEQRQGSADFLSIVGENNAGKSSILEAIRLACSASMKASEEQFPGNASSNGPIVVELEFDQLTDSDRQLDALKDNTFFDGTQQRYRLKRVWKAIGASAENWSYSPDRPTTYQLTGWSSNKKNLKQLGTTDERWKSLLEHASKEVSISKLTQEHLIKSARELQSPLLTESKEAWMQYPGSIATALEAALPSVIYVPALRETSEETDVGSKQSAIRKIVKALFDQQLANHECVIRFKSAADELQELFATEGKHRIVASMEEKLTEKFQELINIRAELKFTTPDVTSDLASSTEFRVLDGALSTRPDNQGHGAQRSIVLALLQLYVEQNRQSASRERQHMLFLIEEPEIYLHPGMCRKMRDTLLKIAQSGVGQVLCTTHSPVFLDLADRHDGIVILRKKDGHPEAHQRTGDVFDQSATDKEQRARLRMLLNFDPAVNEAFFSEKVCLVEGDCELAAIDAVARKLCESGELNWARYLLARRATTIINCRGKWTIPAFQKVLNAFGIHYRVIYDLDEGNQADLANEQIEALLKEGGMSLTHAPNFEKFIFGETWRTDKPWTVTKRIDEASECNERLLEFFEFALGQPLSELRPESVASTAAEPVPPQVNRPRRRNLRNRLKEFKVPHDVIQSARRVDQIFRVAAGPSFAPRPDQDTFSHSIDGTKIDAFAVVAGHSMADTLQDNDVVALRILQGVNLEPMQEADAHTNTTLPSVIENDGIYVLAHNDYIDQKSYTMKRVRISVLPDGNWRGDISADNPETSWGDRGLIQIRKTDRIHFAAQVIGIVRSNDEQPTPVALQELTLVPTEQDPVFEEN
ncbi:ATP-dependent OLD family endonuclease [Corallococcus coralloides DSM 2259]|uniref:ATP-dependent OLD family endonuclease n=1 Tax=Corallococcus coralloides (strain ATCC 25202 / DSM 2259 / NBRC 100086 / M2) TaxID=1144275 RepID=H8MYB4_CORCM|nr:AAA family ATPase [Corallococcus coralloides]AFE03427.1 ATP-dependent OLD family endonuclease [Corallococcus coralloides DSM 2259]